jgi:hypothetical protein
MLRFTKAHTHKTAVPLMKAKGGKSLAAADTLKLKSFLDAEEPQTVKWLVHFWSGQSAAVTYKELLDVADEKQLVKWQKDYANLVNTAPAPSGTRQWARRRTQSRRNTLISCTTLLWARRKTISSNTARRS